MLDEADIYLGIFACRHGYVPRGDNFSITEIEYNHASDLDDLPTFNSADHEPIPEAEIDPRDEYHVGGEPGR